jgi:hypothetical protein
MQQPQHMQPLQQQQAGAAAAAAPPNYTALPPPSLNGGLYTGTPFTSGAPWGNVPVTPDAGWYNFVNLPNRSGDSPAPLMAAMYQVPGGGLRPGNNTPMRPSASVASRIPALHALCVPDAAYTATAAPTKNEVGGFREFAYL